jgi:hypothetical protein
VFGRVEVEVHRCKERDEAVSWESLCKCIELLNFVLAIASLLVFYFKFCNRVDLFCVKVAWQVIFLLFEIRPCLLDIVGVIQQFDLNAQSCVLFLDVAQSQTPLSV